MPKNIWGKKKKMYLRNLNQKPKQNNGKLVSQN